MFVDTRRLWWLVKKPKKAGGWWLDDGLTYETAVLRTGVSVNESCTLH